MKSILFVLVISVSIEGVVYGGVHLLQNDIQQSFLDKAKNQYDKTLDKGEKKVFNSIDNLLPELKRLESAYKKLNIVTSRLDKIRNVNTNLHYSITSKIKKRTKMEEELVRVEILKNESDLILLENMLIELRRGER